MSLANVTQIKGEFVMFNGEYMEAYIPLSFFKSGLAENYGERINVLGLLNVREFDKNNKPLKLETLNFPSMVNIYPTEVNEVKGITLIPGNPPDDYLVAKFYKGDKFMDSAVKSDSTYVELFLNLLLRGKIPHSVPYTKVLNLWEKNLEINKVHLGVPNSILELIIREVYRNPEKPEEPFAKYIGKNFGGISEYCYGTANMRTICARNSTFAAMTFEDFDSMVKYTLNRSKYNKEATISPIEKIISY